MSLYFFLLFFCGQTLISFAQSDVVSSIETRVKNFEERFGIALLYKDITLPNSITQFTAVSGEDYDHLNDYLALFVDEISKYPPGFFKAREVRAIGLVTRLFYEGKPAQGLYSSRARVMFFDVSRFINNKALARHSIHHELFHMMALQTPGYALNDGRWAAFNPEGFVYGPEKKSLGAANPYNPHAPDEPGFATYYAMTSVEEDKAEVFACLMQEVNRTLMTVWAKKDQALRQKIQAMKDFVAIYCPQMNESYWKTLE